MEHRRRRQRVSPLTCLVCSFGCCWLASTIGHHAVQAFGLAPRGAQWNLQVQSTVDSKTQMAALPAEGLDVLQDSLPGVVAAGNALADMGTSVLTGFADQGQNINGILFQSSLLPYLAFLYFLGYKKNNTPPLVQFGFSFLLLFVLATIPTGIISKSTYGLILADSDWLHGTAESLLTCTNIMIVLGFRGALLGDRDLADNSLVRNIAFVWLAAVAVTLASGVPFFGWEAHAQFLSGIGAIPAGTFQSPEPVNALSLPNWLVHWSTVFEFLLAMSLAWKYADATGNQKWKGLTWGMLPSHASSVSALTFHVFYNNIPWILTAQAAFTLLGNITLCIASARIAVSNGWTLGELNPFGGDKESDSKSGTEDEAEAFDVSKVSTNPGQDMPSGPLLTFEIVALTVVASYLTKYGELSIFPGVFQSPDSSALAALIIIVPVSLVLYTIYSRSSDIQQGSLPAVFVSGPAATDVKVSGES